MFQFGLHVIIFIKRLVDQLIVLDSQLKVLHCIIWVRAFVVRASQLHSLCISVCVHVRVRVRE